MSLRGVPVKRATITALVVLVFAGAVLLTAALEGCYRCDGPGFPKCPDVHPDYPAHTRDAGADG